MHWTTPPEHPLTSVMCLCWKRVQSAFIPRSNESAVIYGFHFQSCNDITTFLLCTYTASTFQSLSLKQQSNFIILCRVWRISSSKRGGKKDSPIAPNLSVSTWSVLFMCTSPQTWEGSKLSRSVKKYFYYYWLRLFKQALMSSADFCHLLFSCMFMTSNLTHQTKIVNQTCLWQRSQLSVLLMLENRAGTICFCPIRFFYDFLCADSI